MEQYAKRLFRRFDDRDAKVVILGQGYAGLPVAMRAVEVGYKVVGYDTSPGRIEALRSGRSYVEDISDEELQRSLAAADICMDPDPASPLNNVSTWIKVMEYMAYGKPIVSFDLPETRYSAREAALYVPPNDELAFARATAQLMDDPALRDKMRRIGRERVEKELQWSVVSKNLLAAYAGLNLSR